jgi:hypothetical protein
MKTFALVASLLLGLLVGPAEAKETAILVGGDKAAGKALAKSTDGQWAKSLSKGLRRASKVLAAGGEMTVVVKVAAGDYNGDIGSGAYQFPELNNKDAEFRLEGGYSADFTKRDPFGTPTRIVTISERSAPLLQFHPSRPDPVTAQKEVKSLIVDGLFCDVGSSNNYDKKSNALIQGAGTSTHVVIRWGNTKVGYFELRNCVFMNSPQRAFRTLLRPANETVKFRLYNNLFVNCVMPVKLDSAVTPGGKVVEIEVDHCSFLLNWASTLDPGAGNPCALEIGTKEEVGKITIKNSLFYANFGGAILALNKESPELALHGNNFVGNGLLHKQSESDAVAMIITAGGKTKPVSLKEIGEVEFVDAKDNVSISPGINLSIDSVGALDSSKIEAKDTWQKSINRLFGKTVEAGKVEVKNHAPKKEYDPNNPPAPKNPAAQKYGASPKLVK